MRLRFGSASTKTPGLDMLGGHWSKLPLSQGSFCARVEAGGAVLPTASLVTGYRNSPMGNWLDFFQSVNNAEFQIQRAVWVGPKTPMVNSATFELST